VQILKFLNNKDKEWINQEYRSFIRKQDCIVCAVSLSYEKPDYISHHHRHMGKQDYMLVPLCLRHHNEFHYNESAFYARYGMSAEWFDMIAMTRLLMFVHSKGRLFETVDLLTKLAS